MQNRNGSVALDFGDGTYSFRLGWGDLQKLQEACDAGPFAIFNRLGDMSFKVQDIREILRLGQSAVGKSLQKRCNWCANMSRSVLC